MLSINSGVYQVEGFYLCECGALGVLGGWRPPTLVISWFAKEGLHISPNL